MSDYELLSWSNASSLLTYEPADAFSLEVEFDVGQQGLGGITYYFLVANPQGFQQYATLNLVPGEPYLWLKKVLIMPVYSPEALHLFLQEEVEKPCLTYTNQQLFTYLSHCFNRLDE
jgi:hypothetical protein